MKPFAIRGALEAISKAIGARVPQQPQLEFARRGFFDTTSMLKDETKIYPGTRTLDSIRLVVAHVTDIRGGFGVTKRRVAAWRKLLVQYYESGSDPMVGQAELLDLLPEDEGLDLSANRLALWERYCACPYHWIAAANGDVIRNHPATRRTKHGNSGNRGIGWAVDCAHDEPLTNTLIETGRAALVQALVDVRREDGGYTLVQPHRCFSPQRRVDTDARVWQEIVLPVVQDIAWARIDYHLAEGGGLPVPRDWDRAARFDAKGRPV